jgi:hypothetical protein
MPKGRLRAFDKRLLRRIFGPQVNKVTGGLEKLTNDEVHNLYCMPMRIRKIKSRKTRSAGHVTGIG